MLSWWYGAGWAMRGRLVRERIVATLDYFSIDLLLKTLFAPFRQISAGKVDGPIGVRFRAWVDQMISRIIGFFVRVIIILIGSVTLVIHVLIGGLTLVVWAAIPV
jgi:hypothetical protein